MEYKSEKNDSLFISLDQYTRTPQEKFKKQYCLEALSDIVAGNENKHVYLLPQDKLKAIKSWPFIYWISDEFREKFGSASLEEITFVLQGLVTGDNIRFYRYWWEVNDISKWFDCPKGGPYNKWYGNFWVKVNWEDNGYEIKNFFDDKGKLRSRPQSEKFYFKEGVTYCSSGSRGCSFRYLPANQIISGAGPGIFPSEKYSNINYYLGFLNTILSTYLLESLNPTVNVTQGDIKRVPFARPNEKNEQMVDVLVQNNIDIKKHLCTYSVVEQNYSHSPITPASSPESELTRYYNYENALLTLILLNEAIINRIVFDVYELSEHDRQMVLDKEGIPVGDLSVSQAALDEYKQWLQENQEFPASAEVWEHLSHLVIDNEQPQVSDFDKLYQNNYGWEEFCNSDNHRMNPIEVWYQFRHAGILPPQRTQSLCFELITDVIRTILKKDDDGVIPLCERMGEEPLDVRIEQELVERGYSGAQISQIEQLLCMNLGTGKSLRKYLYEKFFQQLSDHLNLFMYLPKTPFIWHLTSGDPTSGHSAIDLYVSIYTWSRDTLFRIKSVYLANRESGLSDRLAAIDPTTANGKIEAAEIKDQLQELHQFADKIDALLASGYDPKLDDGVGKNIAPLQKAGLLSYEVLNSGQLKKYLNADW